MLKFNVTLDIQRARREVQAEMKEINKGAARALERVATTARKVADTGIRSRVTLSSKVVKDSISIAVPYGQRALIRDIVAKGDPIPLRDYQARKHARKGVTFAVVRGQRKLYTRQGRPGFVVDRIGGHVFVRVTADPPGPAQAKISKVYGPSITQRFRTRAVQDAMSRAIATRWPIEFEREMKFRAGRNK
jgi:hypothetical protein